MELNQITEDHSCHIFYYYSRYLLNFTNKDFYGHTRIIIDLRYRYRFRKCVESIILVYNTPSMHVNSLIRLIQICKASRRVSLKEECHI